MAGLIRESGIGRREGPRSLARKFGRNRPGSSGAARSQALARGPGAARRSRWPSMPWLIRGCVAVVLGFVRSARSRRIAPHDPVQPDADCPAFTAPALASGGSTDYMMGTDQLGRDVLSSLITARGSR
jgi:ABC-type dipeptide/oligopeptide/nickel transport system permease subunit